MTKGHAANAGLVATAANLTTLRLGNNQLSGSLPVELGRAARLESLDLRSNNLAGPIPPEFASLMMLKSLILAHNPALAGPLPAGITALVRLERFIAGGTELCLPADSHFEKWFGAIADRQLGLCLDGPTVYLTQAVQSWDYPVPLLAGEPALLRVFATVPSGTVARMPEVKATFYVNGGQRHSVRIDGSGQPIPTELVEGDLELSANAEIPAEVIVPGLEVVIDVDPDGTLDPALGVTKRIPDSGRIEVDVRTVPDFDLTLIPLLWEGDADSSVVTSVGGMEADPTGHKLLREVRTLLPITDLAVTAHQPVYTSHSDPWQMLAQVEAMRLMEGGSGHWMGVFTMRPGTRRAWPGGYARLGGTASVSIPESYYMAHELGHNLGLLHAPCGGAGGPDPWFPSPTGRIGAWGYDFGRLALVRPSVPDVMSYCNNAGVWISDYHFNKSLGHRLSAAATETVAAANPVQALLVWGGRDEDGVPYLDPAFVVDASPYMPRAAGEYSIEGTTADGEPLFSFSFDMPVNGHAVGEETGFAFTLPLLPEWAGNLTAITLSGPNGSVTLDGTTDRPMAILRDPRTRQVRGFLRGISAATQAQAAASSAVRVAGSGLEIHFSRGIPEAAAWRP